jgi:hypothetical protein
MKKNLLLITVSLISLFSNAQNFMTNGAINDGSGWTIYNQYGIESTNGAVSFSDGVLNIGKTDPTDGEWIHMGAATAVDLVAGWYQFDMEMSYADIDQIWGEVYIGLTAPLQNTEYSGDMQVLKAFNAWDCGAEMTTYTGAAVAGGCDDTKPGKFEITADGTYYLLFRTGGSDFGSVGINLDNLSIVATDAPPAPIYLTTFNFDFETATTIESENLDFNEDAINLVTNGINSSTNVAELSGVNNDWWSQIKVVNNDGIDLSSEDRGVSLKVKGPRALPVTVKIESGGVEHVVTVDYTEVGVWQELKFDFSSFSSKNNTKLALFFDMQVNGDVVTDSEMNVFQIDDFIFGEFAILSTKTFNIENLAVYPNPTSNRWNITAKNEIITSIAIFNVLGKKVHSKQLHSLSASIDATSLTAGLYMAKISTAFGTETIKLVKE